MEAIGFVDVEVGAPVDTFEGAGGEKSARRFEVYGYAFLAGKPLNAPGGFFPDTSMPDGDWWHVLWPQPKDVLARLGLENAAEVIDLCCGDGLFTIPLAEIARHVVAIDLDPEMVARARDRACAAGITNCTFIVGDAYDLARLVTTPADAVLLANTLHGAPGKVRLAYAVASVLKPGGRLIVINWHRRPREETIVLGQPRGPRTELRMAPEDVAAVAAPAGLRAIQCIELPPYHYAAVLERLPL